MKDPPSKIRMGPQRAVTCLGTSKSDVGSGQGIDVMLITCYPVLQSHTSASTSFHVIMPSTPTPPTFTIKLFLDSPFCRLFRLTFSKLIFCLPAGWPSFFLAILKDDHWDIPFRTHQCVSPIFPPAWGFVICCGACNLTTRTSRWFKKIQISPDFWALLVQQPQTQLHNLFSDTLSKIWWCSFIFNLIPLNPVLGAHKTVALNHLSLDIFLDGARQNRGTKGKVLEMAFCDYHYRGVGGIFFPTPMLKPPGGPGGPTHPPPPTPFQKNSMFNFGAKFKYMAPKFKYMVTKFKYIAPKLKYVAPKFKYLTTNSNIWIFVLPKSSRFVRGKFPAPPVLHPPTPPTVLVKN